MSSLRVESDGVLTWLVLDEPKSANRLRAQTIQDLTAALHEIAGDDSVRAVVLRGEGAHFCAGVDLTNLDRLADSSFEENLADSRLLEELFRVLVPYPKLTLAAVHGAVVGAGCGLATACDFVVASEGARFQYTEVKIGFVPAVVSTFLVRRLPGHVVRRLLLDPDFVSAEDARGIGLVDEVVPMEGLRDRARELALSVCRKSPPTSLAATKKVLFETPGMSLDRALAHAAELNSHQRISEDCKHGVRTFLRSKRTPDWLEDPGPAC
jgi:methylglutaconyl-CoA hydratase